MAKNTPHACKDCLPAFAVALLFWLIMTGTRVSAAEIEWQSLAPGMLLARIEMQQSVPPRKPLTVLKLNPSQYALKLLSASREKSGPLPLREWAARAGAAAVINASMYLQDYRTSTGYMRSGDHVNNGRINAVFGAFLLFDPLDPDLPKVRILDRAAPGWQDTLSRYGSVVQNYRLIGPGRKNMWSPGGNVAQVASIALDSQGHVLFIFSNDMYAVHDFAALLLALPLDITQAMYLEGGAVAGLYVDPALLPAGSGPETFSEEIIALPNVIAAVAVPTPDAH